MIFFVIILLLACGLLGLIILVQNPKGGGLAGNVAGFSNQFMGVKQTTDVLEKGTWILASAVVLLCLFSTVFIPKAGAIKGKDIRVAPTSVPMNSLPPQQK
jgi:preprotein translocase subunit SecG